MTRRQRFIALLLAVPMLLAVAAYGRVLHGDFLFDDVRVVQRNPALQEFGGVLRGFWGNLLHGGRPTTEVTFALSHAMGGPVPWAFHSVSLLLHQAVVVLIFLFTREVLRMAGRGPTSGVAVAVAGIFALHPMQSQAVSYVSQRSEVLASGLYLATMLLLLRAGNPGPALRRALAGVAALALFTLGMGAKAIVITAPLAWLLLLAVVPPSSAPGEPPRWRWRLLPFAPLALVGILLVRGALRAVEGRPDAGFSVPGATPGSYFLTQWRAVATYVRLLAWPAGQNADWSFPMSRSMSEPAVLVTGAFLVALLAGAGLLWWRSRRGNDLASADGRAAAFGVAWFFLLLAPTSTFLPIADVLVEHRVYLASWGLILVAVLGGERLLARVAPGRRTLAAAILVGTVWAVLAVALHRRNAVWENDLAFWSDVVEKSPGKARAQFGLGGAWMRRGDLERAAAAFDAGLSCVGPDAPGMAASLLQNLGVAFIQLGRAPEAVAPLRRALEIDPGNTLAPVSLAVALWNTRDLDGAEEVASSVLARSPENAVALRVMGQVRMARGDDAGAVPFLERAVRADPTDPSVRFNLGGAYAGLGRTAEACAAWRAVLRLRATDEVREMARSNLAILRCPQ
jgi:Flp pilus assembly protein TadD